MLPSSDGQHKPVYFTTGQQRKTLLEADADELFALLIWGQLSQKQTMEDDEEPPALFVVEAIAELLWAANVPRACVLLRSLIDMTEGNCFGDKESIEEIIEHSLAYMLMDGRVTRADLQPVVTLCEHAGLTVRLPADGDLPDDID